MLYVANDFSLSMLSVGSMPDLLHRAVITNEQAKNLLKTDHTSAINDETSARLMSSLLGMEVAVGQINPQLKGEDRILVFQVISGHLCEGITELPPDFKYRWELISLLSSGATAELLYFGAEQVNPEVAKELYKLWS